jgi:anti-anti-sigma regulatory factor
MRLHLDIPPVTIEPHEPFDGVAARRVEALLLRARADARFLLDLSQVREVHDFSLAVLAQALERTAADVTVFGLRSHRLAPLRSFGVETERLERALAMSAA